MFGQDQLTFSFEVLSFQTQDTMGVIFISLSPSTGTFNDSACLMCTEARMMLKYFQNIWMRKVPVSLWNVADLDTRTNNCVEGDNTFTFSYCFRLH